MTGTVSARLQHGGALGSRALPAYAAFGLLAFLMAVYTAAYAWSTPSADTADELLRAYEIRHAIAFPLEGPFLGNALHLGPLWWYLAALPLWVSHSWLSVALFVGFLCSLKFPLAYLCGRRLVDDEFGLLWATAMFVPGWPTLEPLVFLNPNAVAAAALLVLFAALKSFEPASRWPTFLALGLAFAIAVHVHPSAAPIGVLLVTTLWFRLRRGQRLAGELAAITTGFLLPFVPYVIGEIANGFSDWGSASRYVSAQVVPANLVNVPAVVADYVVAGPATMAQYLLRWSPGRASVLGLTFAGALLTASAAVFSPRARRWLAVFAGALFVFAAWIACTRPTTPFQFTWMLCPLVAALVALGLRSLARVARLRPVVATIVGISIAFNLIMIQAMASIVEGGEGHLPSRVMDIKDRLSETVFRDVWFPAFAHGRLGAILCNAGELTLHGHLAYIADKDLGLDALFVCRDRSRLSLIAGRAPNHLFGMTRAFWNVSGGQPECWAGSLGLTRAMTPLVERAAIALADGSTYMPRALARHPPETALLIFTAPANAAVVVTNVLGAYEPHRIASAEADGRKVEPLAENDLSSLYRPQSAPVQWKLTVTATNPNAIDVVALDLRSGSGAPTPICRD